MEKTVVIKKIVAYLSLLIIVLYVVTGYGITKNISLGFLTKPLSYNIHTNLIIPLIIFLLAHLFFALNLQKKFKREKTLNKL